MAAAPKRPRQKTPGQKRSASPRGGTQERQAGATEPRATSLTEAVSASVSGADEGVAEPAQTYQNGGPSKPASGLYLVATPIGNLGDMTRRAKEILANVDRIACEDTRNTAKLLHLLGLPKRPLIAYHDHNADQVRPQLLAQLAAGAAIALVSDAGTPLIADPGYKLVSAAVAEGIAVTAAPGANAALTALTLSGLPSDRFLFAGFLPPKTGARRQTLAELAAVPATLIFYETGPRLAASLADLCDLLGDRPAAVARELTKLYEEVRRGSLAELCRQYQDQPAPKGEIVLVIAPPPAQAALSAQDLDQALQAALAQHSVKQAVAEVTATFNLPRQQVYRRALELTGKA